MTMAACYANYEMASLATHNHSFANGQTALISHQQHQHQQQHQQQQQQQQLYHHHQQLLNQNHQPHLHHHHHNHPQLQLHAGSRQNPHHHQQQQENHSHNLHSHHQLQQNQQTSTHYSRQQHQPQPTSSRLSTAGATAGTTAQNAHTSIVPSIRYTQTATSQGNTSNHSNNNSNITNNHNASASALTPATNNPISSSNEAASLCPLSATSDTSDAIGSKDFSVPLHVDCSVEYELPNQPKPPAGQRVEPLLMIHPCYFRKIESQRRSPFVNNMPTVTVGRNSATVNSSTQNSLPSSNLRRSRQNQIMQQANQPTHQRQVSVSATAQYQQQHQQLQHRHSHQQQKMSQMSQQAHYPVVVNQHHHNHHSQQQQKQQNQAESAAVTVNAFIEHTTLNNIRIANQSGHPQRQQQHPLAQRQQRQASAQWEQLTATAAAAAALATKSNMISNRILPSSYNSTNNDAITPSCLVSTSYNTTSDNNVIKALTNSIVGKRDAMISGIGIYNGNENDCSKHRHIQQQNSCINVGNIWNRASRNDAATAAIATSTGNAARIMDRSPTATVPSNYQAGPDTMPQLNQSATMAINNRNSSIACASTSSNYNTKQQQLQQQKKQQHQHAVAAAVAAAVVTSHQHHDHQRYTDKLSGKYRQYLRSQRMHPYLAAATTNTADVVAATSLGQNFQQFTGTSIQQLQQISCYNV